MRKYDTVIFDLDGTLLYTLEDLHDCVNHTMNIFGYPKRTLMEIRKFVGNGIGMLVRRSVPKYVSDAQFELVLVEFKKYYTENCRKKTRPYDGILELIDELHNMGIKMAIVSNKNQKAVTELNKIYFDGKIDVAIGDNGEMERKPAPDSVFRALYELGCNKENTVYVGDSEVDVETVKNAEMRGIFVTWGFRDKDELISAGAKDFIEKPMELIEKIK